MEKNGKILIVCPESMSRFEASDLIYEVYLIKKSNGKSNKYKEKINGITIEMILNQQ